MSTVSNVFRVNVSKIEAGLGLRRLTCDAIKAAITEMDIYGQPHEIKLDERQLAEDLGVSRTPIREALTVLEQEGFVRSILRRGVFVVRKTKREVIEMILVWAAVESMAAGLAAGRATASDIASLREMHAPFLTSPSDCVEDYSAANMAFHKELIRLAGCTLMTDLTNNIFIHMKAVRAMTMRQDNRAERSVQDHLAIITAIERRDAAEAERLVRVHTLNLAAHVERYGDMLDARAATG